MLYEYERDHGMLAESGSPAVLWPLAVYFGLTLLMVVGMLGFTYFLGERHRQRATGTPYESGMPPTRSARLRPSVDFYLLALFFMIFDLEAMFLFIWAVVVREAGWLGYVEALVFAAVLMAALVYLWRLGALDWGQATRRKKQGDLEE